MRRHVVDIVRHVDDDDVEAVADAQLSCWARAALADLAAPVTVVVTVVSEAAIAELNTGYRGAAGATNVLSFPAGELPVAMTPKPLGDVVICAAVVRREALRQGKSPAAHWAHMVVHGVLHLRGFDHQTDAQADVMEARERAIMHVLGYPDPYLERIRMPMPEPN